jgi:hypothetical protein
MVVLIADDRTFGDGVIVKGVEGFGATLVFAFVLDAAPMAERPPAIALGIGIGSHLVYGTGGS